MQFSPEQQYAYDLYLQGKNIFLTGPGGTGKSKWIQTIASRRGIQVCAMTGCAAILLECNAKTVHSWAGIGLGDANKAIKNKFSRDRWLSTEVLIIDEISMMSDTLFDLLNLVGKTIRKSTKPFGGIQLIFCGDFYQLPPVNAKFCFESPDWNKTFPVTVQLSILFRQKNEVYQSILHEIRKGSLSKKNHALLKERILEGDGSIRLVPTRAKADEINERREMKKGGGGALTREKIIATYANKFVCLIDESKFKHYWGDFPIAVEVIPMARSAVGRELLKLSASPDYRSGFLTDNGNIIIDVYQLDMLQPTVMEDKINQIVGVVENGIFAHRTADMGFMGTQVGVKRF